MGSVHDARQDGNCRAKVNECMCQSKKVAGFGKGSLHVTKGQRCGRTIGWEPFRV